MATFVKTPAGTWKGIIRKRGWIREFFALHRVTAGDVVAVEEVGPYQYRLTVVRLT